jgi:hypothetical protein
MAGRSSHPRLGVNGGQDNKMSDIEAYDKKIKYWNDYARRWGHKATLERATRAYAGGILGRGFCEDAAAFVARTPHLRATLDWLNQNRTKKKA